MRSTKPSTRNTRTGEEDIVANNDYRFISHWRIRASVNEVADILEDAQDLPRWWPSVYLDVRIVSPPHGAHGLGEVVELYTKGYLPYRLRWRFTVVEERYPYGSTIEAHGDFVGRGIWTFSQDGDFVDATYDWRIRAEKPLLKLLTPVLRPLFSWNHRWAMAQGEESLKKELARRSGRANSGLRIRA